MAEFLEKSCKISGNIVKMNLIEETKGFLLDYFGFSSKRIKYNGFYWQNIQFPCQKFLGLKLPDQPIALIKVRLVVRKVVRKAIAIWGE